MPKGQAAISWTPENDAKLLLSIIYSIGGSVDYSKVAQAFGPDVPGSCIQTRIRNLRKKAAGMGMVWDSPNPKKRSAVAEHDGANKKVKPAKEEEEEASKVIPSTPTKIGDASPTKIRATPRKLIKRDYAKLENPFADLEDVHSEEMLFDTEKFDSEDSAGSDTSIFTPTNKGPDTKIKAES